MREFWAMLITPITAWTGVLDENTFAGIVFAVLVAAAAIWLRFSGRIAERRDFAEELLRLGVDPETVTRAKRARENDS